jgi:hypothetical protein
MIVCGIAFGVASCAPTVEVATCIPDDAKREEASGAAAAARVSSSPTSVDLYLDASGSMRGFVQEKKAGALTFTALLGDLYTFQDQGGHDKGLFAFGACVVDVTGQIKEKDAYAPEFYRAAYWDALFRKKKPPECPATGFIQTSQLDLALERIKDRHAVSGDGRSSGRLSVVVTDLFLTGDGKTGELSRALKPIETILQSGSAVGVLGVRVPFRGKPDPWEKEEAYRDKDYAGRMAAYVLMIGHSNHIEQLRSYLAGASLNKEVSTGGWDGAGELHFHLFTRNRFAAIVDASALHREDGGVLATSPAPLVDVAQPLAVLRSINLQSGARWGAKAEIPQLAGTWPMSLTASTETWSFDRKTAGCPMRWSKLPSLVQARAEGSVLKLAFETERLHRLTPRLTHFSRVDVATESDPEPHPPAWLAKWSISESRVRALAAAKPAPDFVPTVNLQNILTEFERAALKPQTERSPVSPVGIVYLAYRRE